MLFAGARGATGFAVREGNLGPILGLRLTAPRNLPPQPMTAKGIAGLHLPDADQGTDFH
jgi:hypothetical protein